MRSRVISAAPRPELHYRMTSNTTIKERDDISLGSIVRRLSNDYLAVFSRGVFVFIVLDINSTVVS